MKYVIGWEVKPTAGEESQARSLQVFGKWQPSERSTFHEFLGRVDGRGGFAVVETDDPRTIANDLATFGPFFDFQVHQVLDIRETTEINGEAIAFRQSIT